MKGVILSTSFFIVFMSLFVINNWSNQYSFRRQQMNYALKRGMNLAALSSVNKKDQSHKTLKNIVDQSIKKELTKGSYYKSEVFGYNKEPFAFRVRLYYHEPTRFSPIQFTLEETIIEEVDSLEN